MLLGIGVMSIHSFQLDKTTIIHQPVDMDLHISQPVDGPLLSNDPQYFVIFVELFDLLARRIQIIAVNDGLFHASALYAFIVGNKILN